MSISNTQASREKIDLSNLVFTAGQVGRLMTVGMTPVLAGDSYEQNFVGSFRLSALRRGLAVDSTLDLFTFYVPFRHIYGDQWIQLMEGGVKSTPITGGTTVDPENSTKLSFLGINCADYGDGFVRTLPRWAFESYRNIWNEYFKVPYMDDWASDINGFLDDDDAEFGKTCAHLKSIWTTPLPPQRDDGEVATETDSINLLELNQQYGELHTEQERQLFMHRYRDIMSNMGGSTHYDADNRPHLLMRSTTWASGYDVDGTGQDTLGQHTGRVMQSFKHQVPRFFVPEHGVMVTVALNRFPPTHTGENHYLMNQPSVNYHDYAGDPAIVANHPPVEFDTGDIFNSPVTSTLGEMAHSQWFRYSPDVVHRRYDDLEGYPFLKFVPVSDEQRLYVRPSEYNDMFQTTQLGHWNMQAKNNQSVYRALPTVRDSAMTSN